jgi:hypothetical protein
MYPSPSSIFSLASQWGQNPAAVFAYVSAHQGQMPSSQGDLLTFIGSMQNAAGGMSVDVRLVFGYVTEYGATPDHNQLTVWAVAHGYSDSAGNITNTPAPGSDYPGNAVPIGNQGPSNAPGNQTPAPAPFGIQLPDFSGILQNKPLLYGGVGLAALWVLNPHHWRGRS